MSVVRGLARSAYHLLEPVSAADRIYSFVMRHRFRRCGRRLRIRVTSTILSPGRIVIGDGFTSMGHLYLYANDGGSIEIGNDCNVNTNVQIGAGAGKIVIGNYVLIASNVVLRAANHGTKRGPVPMRHQATVGGEIIIGDDVWLGSNCVVTSGVTIATGTVVGAGAVVTRSTEPYSIVGGVPARKIGERS